MKSTEFPLARRFCMMTPPTEIVDFHRSAINALAQGLPGRDGRQTMGLAGSFDAASEAKRCARAGRLILAKELVGADNASFQVRLSLLGVLRNATIAFLRQARRDVLAEPSDERQTPSSSNLLTNQTRRRLYGGRSPQEPQR